MTRAVESPAPQPIAAAIAVHNLRFAYAGQTILHISDWRVPVGARIFLRGASGTGKSTLLNLLCGMLVPASGELKVLGQNLFSLRAHARDTFRAQHMGVVFQQFNLIPWMSVRDNIRLAAHFGGQRQMEAYLPELVAHVNLSASLLDQKAGALSIGQQQRVAVVRALINRPEILLVDEPTSALDQDNRDAFMHLLMQVVAACGATLIFVSHDRALATHFKDQLDIGELNRAERNG